MYLHGLYKIILSLKFCIKALVFTVFSKESNDINLHFKTKYVPEGRNKRDRVATPTSFFDLILK